MAEAENAAALERFLLLAKSAKGSAAVALIGQALDNPKLYVFAELLDVPSIKELATTPNKPHYDLLVLFAYGTYADWMANQASLPPLTQAQQTKLRLLTIISLASRAKTIPYAFLSQQLGIGNLRELEDLIIEGMYLGIVQGHLDQRNAQLEVDSVLGRDLRPEQLGQLVASIGSWLAACENIMGAVRERALTADSAAEERTRREEALAKEIADARKSLKAHEDAGVDVHRSTEFSSMEYFHEDSRHKGKAKARNVRSAPMRR